MSVKAVIAIAGAEKPFPTMLESEPKIGETIRLHVDGEDKEFIVTEVEPTGFTDNAPYLYGVYVKPKA